jgi:NADPH:quinone reductase-like Zn-dependent oxidoreductase
VLYLLHPSTQNSTIKEEIAMQAIAVRDRDAGLAGLSLADLPYPHAAENDVIVRVHAAGFTRGELAWPRTWTDRVGRAADQDRALDLGVDQFVDLEADRLEDAGEADVVLDVIGGDILRRSTSLVRAGGTLVTIAEPPTIQPDNGRAMFFVVEADRSQLAELAQRLRDGRLSSNVGAVRPLAEAPAAFGPDAPRVPGKAVIQVTEGW